MLFFRPCGRTVSATVGYFPSESCALSVPRLRVIFEPPATRSRQDSYAFLDSNFIPLSVQPLTF